MDKQTKAFLFDLLHTPSPSGFETPGQKKWLQYVKNFSDEVDHDAYGTAWATLLGKAKKPQTIMLEAHADEIGYIIKHISPEGFLYIDRIGGSDTATARGRRLTIFGEKNPVFGIIGNTAIHIRDRKGGEKVPEVHQLYVDVGAKNKREVEKMGIRIGHPAVYADAVEELGKERLVGRALDNRIGGFIIAQVLVALSKAKVAPDNTVYAVNAVQEEIGGQGAKMIAHRLMPTVALVLDVTHATDTPGIKKAQHGEIILGKGPTVTHGACNHPAVVQRLLKIAKQKKIPVQHESVSRHSGTDTDQIYHVREGIPSALLSLPLRYMHSVVETADYMDIKQTIKLLTEFVLSMKATESFAATL